MHAVLEVLIAPSERPATPIALLDERTVSRQVLRELKLTPTPFRVYQDVASLLLLPRYAPRTARVLDVGCGPGPGQRHFRVIGTKGSYLGVDIVADAAWPEIERASADSDFACRFVQMDARDIGDLGPFDVVYSSSSLEHMPDLPRVISNIACVSTPGALSFHLVPAPFSVLVYGSHGYRRFSAGHIERLFRTAGFDVLALIALGGLASYVVHAGFATIPALIARRDLRSFAPRAYARSLESAISFDRILPVPHLGFALIARLGHRAKNGPMPKSGS